MMFGFLFFLLFGLINCEEMVDPHDLFDDMDIAILKSRQGSNDKAASKFGLDDAPLNICCTKLVSALVNGVNKQLPDEIDKGNRIDVTLSLSFSAEEAIRIRSNHFSNGFEQGDICALLERSFYPKATSLDIFARIWSWIKFCSSLLTSLFKYIYYSRPDVKMTTTLQLFVGFGVSIFLFLKFKSKGLVILWILSYMVFISTQATYMLKLKVAQVEQEAMFHQFGNQMPEECVRKVKSRLHKFYEYIFGPTPVSMSQECLRLLKKMKIPAEMEVKLLDCFIDTVGRLFTDPLEIVFLSVDNLSNKFKGDYPWYYSWIIKCVYFIMILTVSIGFLGFLCGGDLSFLGVSLKQSYMRQRGVHRDFIEHVETQPIDRSVHVGSAGLPPADWLHNLLRLQSETVESKTQRKLLDEFGDIPVTTVRQRNRKPSFKKLKSWNALRAATATPPAAANTSRRCSF